MMKKHGGIASILTALFISCNAEISQPAEQVSAQLSANASLGSSFTSTADHHGFSLNEVSSQRPREGFGTNALIDGLPQFRTNGRTPMGTLQQPYFLHFMRNNPLPNGYPWSRRGLFTNYYEDEECPVTGVTQRYNFFVSPGVIAPDGYQRQVLLVNGQFPGPLIQANWGDDIEVTVHNNIYGSNEGLALHWHGFLQHHTPWQDGVPGVGQCPIPPGKSFTYRFRAQLYGTTWYHSHYSAQYAGGLFGPLIIYGPASHKYDIDVGPVMLSDWYHRSYQALVEETLSPQTMGPIAIDSNLINGKNNFDCSTLPPNDRTPCSSYAGFAKFRFIRGKVHRLRLINSGADAIQKFSIDGHAMLVIANDFVPILPYETSVVTLGISQRADVLVKANGRGNAFWMRSTIPLACHQTAKQLYARAIIFYDNGNGIPPLVGWPPAQPWPLTDAASCANDPLPFTRPIMRLPVVRPDRTFEFDLTAQRNQSGSNLWYIDGVSFRVNYNSPSLLLSNLGHFRFEREWNVRSTDNARTVRVIVNNKSPFS